MLKIKNRCHRAGTLDLSSNPVQPPALPLRYRYRTSPHPHQEEAPARMFGCARVVWNDPWARCQELHRQGETDPGSAARRKCCTTQARGRPERAWLGEVANIPLQQSSRKLDQALRNWWRSKGRVRAPRFKRRNNRQSIRLRSNAFRVEDQTLRLTRVGSLPIAWSRSLPAGHSSITIIKDCAGRSVASFVVAVEREQLEPNGNAVALDLGWASLAVTRDGVKIAPPPFRRAAPRWIRRLQRSLSPKAKGANNRARARLRRAVAHATVADQRPDPLHKLATGPIREHQTVCIEHLNGVGMAKNQKLARSIADAGWCLLRTPLASRAGRDGPTVQAVSRWQPTSRTCWECGHRGGKKDVSIRWWRCPACGTEQDRDGNAACTIFAAALAARVSACGAEGKTSGLASGREAGTHLNREVRKWIP